MIFIDTPEHMHRVRNGLGHLEALSLRLSALYPRQFVHPV